MAEKTVSVTVHMNAAVVGIIRNLVEETFAKATTANEAKAALLAGLDHIDKITEGIDKRDPIQRSNEEIREKLIEAERVIREALAQASVPMKAFDNKKNFPLPIIAKLESYDPDRKVVGEYERGARDVLEAFKAYFSDEDSNFLLDLTDWGGEAHWDSSEEGAVQDVLRQKGIK